MIKALAKPKSKPPTPVAVVQTAYDLKLTTEAVGRLKEITDAVAYAAEQTAIAKKISIKDDDSNAAGADVVVNLTKTRKVLDELQKYFTGPFESAKKVIIAKFKELGAEAETEEKRLRKEAEDLWMAKENQRRKDKADRIAKQQEEERKARQLGRAAPKPIAAAPAPEPERTTRTDNGALGIKLVWGFDVVDAALVPRKYLTIDEKAIRAAIALGERSIPGINISERPQSAVR